MERDSMTQSEEDERIIIPEQDSSSSYEASSESDDASVKPSLTDSEVRLRTLQSSKAGSGQDASNNAKTFSQGSQSHTRAKKRSATIEEARKVKARRLQGSYNNNYRRLLNVDIHDATSQSMYEVIDPLPQSQIGLAIWSSAEKELFFTALSRLGKDDTVSIAARIGTKSSFEVQEYIQFLHQGMVENNLNEVHHGVPGLVEYPAALQISHDCDDVLELAADALTYRQERHEEQIEMRKWGAVPWLLDTEAESWLEERLSEENEREALYKDLPSIELLDLSNFLHISRSVFMNPAAPRQDENWQYIAEADEQPSIRTTAFEDFYHLVISITRKLVSATIFIASSRLRSTDSKSFHSRPTIRTADVEAAAKSIGLKLSSDQFWIECPRRCNLKVYRRQDDWMEMDYNLLESILGGRDDIPQDLQSAMDYTEQNSPIHTSTTTEPESPMSTGQSDSEVNSNSDVEVVSPKEIMRDLASEYMDGIALEHNGPFDPSDSEFETMRTRNDRVLKKAYLKRETEQAQHDYSERFDVKASLAEEQRLWTMLRQQPPFTINPDAVELSDEPFQDRKEGEDLEDWREKMEFWSQWETLNKPIPEDAFSRSSTN